jgi:gluconolactonase
MSSIFKVHDARFLSIIGSSPTLDLISENNEYPFAHEAGVFIPSTNELFITSNQFLDQGGSELKVLVSGCVLSTGNIGPSPTCQALPLASAAIPMANGGVNYNDNQNILFCGQGDMARPSGLNQLSVTLPYETKLFNSVNDVMLRGIVLQPRHTTR